MRLVAMLDTCVLVDFFLVYLKEEKRQKLNNRLKLNQKLLRKYEGGDFFNIMSYWNKWELRQVVKQLKLEQKFILEGFLPREFGDAKKEIKLEEDEIKLVNSAVSDIWFYSTRNTPSLDYNDLRKIEKLTKKGFSFMDCIHVLMSKKSGCEYFVTSDRELKRKSSLAKEFNIKIIGVKTFLSKL